MLAYGNEPARAKPSDDPSLHEEITLLCAFYELDFCLAFHTYIMKIYFAKNILCLLLEFSMIHEPD